MFREMRRKRQQLSQDACIQILTRGTSGTLAVCGDEGYPYAVPLSYVYRDGRLYFHCGKSGHKLDGLQRSPKVSFCVNDQDQVMPEEYTSYFRSVILFGQARILQQEEEIHSAITWLAEKYHPTDSELHRNETIHLEANSLCMVEIKIEHMTGKQARELMRQGF